MTTQDYGGNRPCKSLTLAGGSGAYMPRAFIGLAGGGHSGAKRLGGPLLLVQRLQAIVSSHLHRKVCQG